MATVYFTASSLDGYIVDEAESLDWLTSRAVDADGAFGYHEFIKSVGALVMGSATYEWVVKNHPGDWPYEQPSWVLTGIVRGSSRRASGADVRRRCRRAASGWCLRRPARDVWVVGGGDAARSSSPQARARAGLAALWARLAAARGCCRSVLSGRWWSPVSTATSSAPVGARPSGGREARGGGRIPLT